MTDGYPRILAVDIGGTFIKSALFSPSGDILPGSADETRIDSDGTAEAIERSFRAVAHRMASRAERMGSVIGVGISTPGPFDYERGCCLMDHKYRAIKGLGIRRWFTDVFGSVPIRFVHDATACMLGLMNELETDHYSRVAAVTLGTGLGFTISIDGKIQTNGHGGPAISLFDRPYRDGIAEDYVSRRGILARYRQASEQTEALDVVDIATLAQNDDLDALRIFQETGTMLGEILRVVLTEQQIECLVIGGQIARASRLFEASLRTALSEIPSLQTIQPVSDVTALPLRGAFLDVLQNTPEICSPKRKCVGREASTSSAGEHERCS